MKTVKDIARKAISVAREAKWVVRKQFVKVLRRLGLLGEEWTDGLSSELRFWEEALAENGRNWSPEEFRARMDPELELQSELKELIDAPEGAMVRVLDVGSGPLVKLGKRWQGRTLDLVPVDPLADEYRLIFQRLSLKPPLMPTVAHGEKLLERFKPNEFDLTHASNSLDHSYDPLQAIRQMLIVTKPKGFVYLWHFVNEGLDQAYHGLHQWNFYTRNGDLLVSDGRRTFSARQVFQGLGEVRCQTVRAYGKNVVVAIIKKLAAS